MYLTRQSLLSEKCPLCSTLKSGQALPCCPLTCQHDSGLPRTARCALAMSRSRATTRKLCVNPARSLPPPEESAQCAVRYSLERWNGTVFAMHCGQYALALHFKSVTEEPIPVRRVRGTVVRLCESASPTTPNRMYILPSAVRIPQACDLLSGRADAHTKQPGALCRMPVSSASSGFEARRSARRKPMGTFWSGGLVTRYASETRGRQHKQTTRKWDA